MFPKQQQLEDIMSDAGFKVVSHTDLTFGVVSVHSGFKL
jgi:2-methoxy-6-polyprenyl-1,4-benzoquinol methylase